MRIFRKVWKFGWEAQIDPKDPNSSKILKLVGDNITWNIQFAEKGGLIVIAQSISMSMNHVTVMYDNLVNGGTFGNAFRSWGEYMQSFGSPSGWAFTLLYGDPFIRFDIPNHECVIHTSFVGTKHECRIREMRVWRDEIFNNNRFGRFMVGSYYILNPPFAWMARKSQIVRKLNRFIFASVLIGLKITPWY